MNVLIHVIFVLVCLRSYVIVHYVSRVVFEMGDVMFVSPLEMEGDWGCLI